jgi:hypothetical protein
MEAVVAYCINPPWKLLWDRGKSHTNVVTADLRAVIRTQNGPNTNQNKPCVSTAVALAPATKAKTAVSALCSIVPAECAPHHQAIENTRPLTGQEIKIRSGNNCIKLKIELHTVFLVCQRILCGFSIWILLDE